MHNIFDSRDRRIRAQKKEIESLKEEISFLKEQLSVCNPDIMDAQIQLAKDKQEILDEQLTQVKMAREEYESLNKELSQLIKELK